MRGTPGNDRTSTLVAGLVRYLPHLFSTTLVGLAGPTSRHRPGDL
jgi:hypothetical protein